jgi:hypothetical protein
MNNNVTKIKHFGAYFQAKVSITGAVFITGTVTLRSIISSRVVGISRNTRSLIVPHKKVGGS